MSTNRGSSLRIMRVQGGGGVRPDGGLRRQADSEYQNKHKDTHANSEDKEEEEEASEKEVEMLRVLRAE